MKILNALLGLLCCLAVSCSVGVGQDAADPQWPLQIERGDSRILLYQLQPEALSGDELSARAAVSIARGAAAEPIFGAVWIDARIATDRDARTVTLLDVTVPDVRFPAATEAERADLVEVLRSELTKLHPTFSLDDLVATLDPAVQAEPGATDLRNDPPHIVFVTRPTALVTVDGDPQLREIEGSRLMRVVNTPFILVFDPAQKVYHLNAGGRWLRASALEGPWQKDPPSAVTSELTKLASGTGSQAIGEDSDVMVVTAPTELIVAQGEARWTPLEGNELLYLANSENDVFLEGATRTWYVLLAGRWYSSASLEKGPWKYVAADQLPASFAQIPADSKKARVRTFIAGTSEAREAVLDASIPQTTAIKRSDAHCSVVYDGQPRFAPITGTTLRYAVNTTSSVIEFEGRYYCCSEGVWYIAEAPSGPWAVASEIPEEVYTIPPSCPIYPVRYVYVYDSTPEYVWVGYLPGYTGCYVAGPTIVYGTGFWYPGWVGVTYCPRPWTWGFRAHYDPWYCGWNFGFSFAWGVNPWWFNHSCGWGSPGWWGVGGFHAREFEIQGSVVTQVSLARTTTNVAAVIPVEGRENVYNREPNRTRLAPVSGSLARADRAIAVPNNVFADRDGNVRRRTQDGWEERQQSQWKRAAPLAGAPEAQGPAGARVPALTDRTDRTGRDDRTGRERGVPAPPQGRPSDPGSLRPERERPSPVTPPTSQTRPAPIPPSDRGRPSAPLPPATGRPAPSQPPIGLPLPPQSQRPLSRPAPIGGQSLRPIPGPGDNFDRMREARERGNIRSSNLRQRPGRGRNG